MVHLTVVVESALAPPLTHALLDLSGAASTCLQLRAGSFKTFCEASLDMAVEKLPGSVA